MKPRGTLSLTIVFSFGPSISPKNHLLLLSNYLQPPPPLPSESSIKASSPWPFLSFTFYVAFFLLQANTCAIASPGGLSMVSMFQYTQLTNLRGKASFPMSVRTGFTSFKRREEKAKSNQITNLR
jgi:hypothetical protein